MAATKEEIKEAMETLMNGVNSFDSDSIASIMHDVVKSNHRTLQQSFVRNLQIFLDYHSRTEYTDLRNEASVEFAKAVRDLEHHLPMV
jgi:hypothetical protein